MPTRALTSDNVIAFADFTVEVKPHPRARRVTLRYNPKKSCFTVTTPKRTSKKFILEFLHTHQAWMAQQQRIAPPKADPVTTGIIPVEGHDRRIVHEEAVGVQVDLLFDTLLVRCKPERQQRAIQRFLKQHAEKIIVPLAREKARSIGKVISDISFRDTTSRWGSCSHDRKLSFSWRLIMAPFEVIDYVVAHEVAHLQHFDHSPDFWALCRTLSKDYTTGKHWLKLNGQHLQQIEV